MRAIGQSCHWQYPEQMISNHGPLPSAIIEPTGPIDSSSRTPALPCLSTDAALAFAPGQHVPSEPGCASLLTASKIQPSPISAEIHSQSQAREAASNTIHLPLDPGAALPDAAGRARWSSRPQIGAFGGIRAMREPIPVRRGSQSCVQSPALLSSSLSSSLQSTPSALLQQDSGNPNFSRTQEKLGSRGSLTEQHGTGGGDCTHHSADPTVRLWQEPDVEQLELARWLATPGWVKEQRDETDAPISHHNADAIARRWSQPDLRPLDVANRMTTYPPQLQPASVACSKPGAWQYAGAPRRMAASAVDDAPFVGRAAEEPFEPTATVNPTLLTECSNVERGLVPTRSQLSPKISSTLWTMQKTAAAVAMDQHNSSTQRRRSTPADVDKANTTEADRRFPCPLCRDSPRSFGRPSALRIHMLTHTGEKRE